jgi:hypothetical protein
MNISTPFEIKEIKISLILQMDIESLIELHLRGEKLLDDPLILLELSKHFDCVYKGLKYKDGIAYQVQLINTFEDLVFYVYLKDDKKRWTLYLTPPDMLKNAIQMNDFKLFVELVSSIGIRESNSYRGEARFYGLDDNTPLVRYMLFDQDFKYTICEQAGIYNNWEIIEYILSNTMQRNEEHFYSILGGLLEANHNKMFLQLIENLNWEINIKNLSESIIYGNNIEMFKKYFKDIRGRITERFFQLLAEKNRFEMINMILTNNGELAIESALTDNIKTDLFYGYLKGGFLEKSKDIYEQIHNKDIINRRIVLVKVVSGNNIECYKYAIQLLKITKPEIINMLSNIHKMSNTLWFILNKVYPEKWEIVFDSFLEYGNDFNTLIRIIKEFNPRLILLHYFVNKIEKFELQERAYNELLLRWLREKINEQNK